MKKTLWKNNLNFIKDVPMIYINCNVTVIIVSVGKNRRHYPYRPSYVICVETVDFNGRGHIRMLV